MCLDAWTKAWTEWNPKHMDMWVRWMNLMHNSKFNAWHDTWQDGQEPLLNELGFQSIPWSKGLPQMEHKHQASFIRVSWYTPYNQGLQSKHEAPQSVS